MAIKDLKRIKVQDQDLATVQESVYDFTRQINKVLTDGVILKDVLLGTSTTDVSHGLRRAYEGWQIIDVRGDVRVWRDATATSDNTKFLPLKASAAVTVSLWVF